MKIESYSVGMSSTSVSSKTLTVSERLRIGTLSANTAQGGFLGLLNGGNNGRGDTFALSQGTRQRRQPSLPPPPPRSNQSEGARTHPSSMRGMQGITLSDRDKLRITLIERMMEKLTGKKYRFNTPDSVNQEGGPQQGGHPWAFSNNNKMMMDANRFFEGLQQGMVTRIPAISLERTETYHEFQQMTFQASGIVNTSDGRQIQFDINVFSSYEFSSSTNLRVDALQFADPLIINFDGTLPEFTKDRYEFDLTIDGTMNSIFMPTNGSGFLVLDKNGDGIINDGSELFGAKTGDGFWELMAYDDDGNGWIDEGDSVFEHLKIMFVDRDSGEYMMISLKEAGVGAIYLGSVAADYEIKTAENEVIGAVRKNGIFLYESGSAGTIHHIDLTY